MHINYVTKIAKSQEGGSLPLPAEEKTQDIDYSATKPHTGAIPQPDIKDFRKADGKPDWDRYRKALWDHNNKQVAHQNVLYSNPSIEELKNNKNPELRFSVPLGKKVLTKSLYYRRFDDIRDFLIHLGVTGNLQREAVLKLIKLNCYYSRVYPKAQTVADDCYISKRTYWRAVKKLEDTGLIERESHYYNRRQTSNLYHLDKLLLVIAHRLAEIGQALNEYAHRIFKLFNNFWIDIWDPENKVDLSLEAPIKLKLPI